MERIYNLKDIIDNDTNKVIKKNFFTTDLTNGVIWIVPPGQEVHKHVHHQSDDIWVCIAGEGIFYPDLKQEVQIKSNCVVVSPKGKCHGIKNIGKENLVFISIVNPIPSDYEPL